MFAVNSEFLIGKPSLSLPLLFFSFRISREDDGFRTCVFNMALEDAKKQLKNDNYEDYMIEEAYEKVFFECVKDSRPFDRIPESVKDVDSSVDAFKFILKK